MPARAANTVLELQHGRLGKALTACSSEVPPATIARMTAMAYRVTCSAMAGQVRPSRPSSQTWPSDVPLVLSCRTDKSN
jgi:hypothetical protein